MEKIKVLKSPFLLIAVVLLLGLAFGVYSLKRHHNMCWRHAKTSYKPIVKNHGIASRKGRVMKTPFTEELQGVSILDSSIVLDTKVLAIPGIFAPYNGSITEYKDGYLLVFRYDHLANKVPVKSFASMGLVHLNRNFEPIGPVRRIYTGSNFSEDPRVFRDGEDYYLVYNDLVIPSRPDRVIHLASLHPKTGAILHDFSINAHLKYIEKNWSPFIYRPPSSEKEFYFEYMLSSPRKILKLEELERGDIQEIIENAEEELEIPWDAEKWGEPLGGTPAQLVDGEYLAFFHSKFVDENRMFWYLAGAYTFEAEPPFRITSMSKEPILFETIYRTPLVNTSETWKQVLFPAGFVLEEKEDKTFIHLSCGENDCAIKILTLDKEAFMKTLVRLDQ